MALAYFESKKVDYAVIEVGLGGRLDATNIITPQLAVITNIGLDHTEFLGDSLAEIAYEKAGIIKENIPVVIGEIQPETARANRRRWLQPRYFVRLEQGRRSQRHQDRRRRTQSELA